MRGIIVLGLALSLVASAALADKTAYLDLARRGWNYELRRTMVGRDLSIPVVINGRHLAGSELCLVGEAPHPQSLQTLDAFRQLLERVHGTPLPMRIVGKTAQDCEAERTVVLRLYSGDPPNRGLSEDLGWLSEIYGLGLPKGRNYAATSPAMAQTFFGRRGQATHIMVKQPPPYTTGPLETAFYRSILIEELFQAFTFGMDVMLFDRSLGFRSKLQETPVNLSRLPWGSRRFMQALLRSNPAALCTFDVFMLHAVADSPVAQTTDPAFLEFIDSHFEHLTDLTEATLAESALAAIIDPLCQGAEN